MARDQTHATERLGREVRPAPRRPAAPYRLPITGVRPPGASRSEWIRTTVRNWLDDGLIAPGERFPTTEHLAMIFGVSTQPVRTALAPFKQDGLLTSSTRGTFVTTDPRTP